MKPEITSSSWDICYKKLKICGVPTREQDLKCAHCCPPWRIMGDICWILFSTINHSMCTLYWNKNISIFWINDAFITKLNLALLLGHLLQWSGSFPNQFSLFFSLYVSNSWNLKLCSEVCTNQTHLQPTPPVTRVLIGRPASKVYTYNSSYTWCGELLQTVKEERNILQTINRRLTGLVTSCVWTAF